MFGPIFMGVSHTLLSHQTNTPGVYHVRANCTNIFTVTTEQLSKPDFFCTLNSENYKTFSFARPLMMVSILFAFL